MKLLFCLRFSLRTLVLGVLFLGSLPLLKQSWAPWQLTYRYEGVNDKTEIHLSDDRKYALFEDAADNCAWFNIEKKKSTGFLTGGGDLYRRIVLSGRRTLLVQESSAQLIDSETGKQEAVIQKEGAFAGYEGIEAFPDLNAILAITSDGRARIWTFKDKEAYWESPNVKEPGEDSFDALEKKIEKAAVSPDGSRFVTYDSHHGARMWEYSTGRELFRLQDSSGIQWIWFRGDSLVLATARGDPERNATWSQSRVWNARDGKTILKLGTEASPAKFGVPFPDMQRFLIEYENGRMCVVDRSGHVLAEYRLPPGPSQGRWISPDGQRLVIGHPDGTARLLDRHLKELAFLQASAGFVDFSPDGTRFLMFDDGVRILSTADGAALAYFHADNETEAYFSQDGRRIVAAPSSYDFGIWERRRPEPFYGVFWLPATWITLGIFSVMVFCAIRDWRRTDSS